MSLSRQPAAYRDCDELFRLAITHATGARVPIGPRRAAAHQFQLRMNNYRTILREQTARIYPSDHPLYATSEFDHLSVTIAEDTKGEWWVYVKPSGDWGAIRAAEPIPASELPIPVTTGTPDHEPSDLE